MRNKVDAFRLPHHTQITKNLPTLPLDKPELAQICMQH
jgi:hypothetical protein